MQWVNGIDHTLPIHDQSSLWTRNRQPSRRAGSWQPYYMADTRVGPSQWETSLQSNTVSHWLGASLESAMILCYRQGWERIDVCYEDISNCYALCKTIIYISGAEMKIHVQWWRKPVGNIYINAKISRCQIWWDYLSMPWPKLFSISNRAPVREMRVHECKTLSWWSEMISK